MPTCWSRPLCLVQSTRENGIQINRGTLAKLQEVREKVVVAAIAGIYRTGKSYLMNILAGEQGFELGSTIVSQTKGIWIWVRPHPSIPDCCLVLLDTEGLADPEKGSPQHDTMIFALTVLLSSSLTYNSQNTIDNDAIGKLHFVTEMAEHVKVRADTSEEVGTEFARVFPAFIWAVRDFHLELSDDGRQISSDQYLEKAIQLRKGTTPAIMMFNMPRECLRKYFPSRKCFTFPQPVERREDLKKLDSIPINQLNRDFLQVSEEYVNYILSVTSIKNVAGQPINGRMLANLAQCYVTAIQSGAIPCIETAVDATAKIENTRAVQEAVNLYKARMSERVQLPTENVEALSQVHHLCEKEAIGHFLQMRIFDKDQAYQKQFNEEITAAYEDVCRKNEEESERLCTALIQKLYQEVVVRYESGYYSRPGGYQQYKTDMDQLQMKYAQTHGKGPKANSTISAFMASKEAEANAILAADQKLDAEQKKAEAERQRAEAAIRDEQAAREEAARIQQEIVDQQQTYEENMRQLHIKMEEDRKMMMEDNEKMVQSKLEEQERLLREGFNEKAEEMREEIRDLREAQRIAEQEAAQNGFGPFGLIGKAIDTVLSFIKPKVPPSVPECFPK